MCGRPTAADDIALHTARVLAILLLAAVYVLFVGTTAGREIDGVLAHRDLAPNFAGLWLIIAALFLALLSPLGVGLLVVGLLWHARRLGRRDDGVRAAVIVVTAAMGARVLEALLQRLDPVGGEAARQLGSAFYPSGHAAAAMALCLATIVVLRDHPRPWLLLAGGTWCSVHGFAILANRSHHISDVLGGFLLGFAVAATIGLRASSDVRLGARAGQRTVLVMLAGVVIAVMAADLARRMTASSLPPRAALAAATAGLCATAFSLVSLFLRLLDADRGGAAVQG